MGDFEDIFGAGVDVVDIIEGIGQSYIRANNKERVNWYGNASEKEVDHAVQLDQDEAWIRRMKAKGYKKGPCLRRYEDILEWQSGNSRPHVRRPTLTGYQVFFTD